MAGLEGVVVADTELSSVDGERGELVIRGRRIEELAGHASFEEACALLWGVDPAPLRAYLGRARALAFDLLPELGTALDAPDGMDALRAATAHVRLGEDDERVRITGALAVFVAAWLRLRAGAEPLTPDPTLGHAEDLLRMATGSADPARVAALDAYLVTVIDHGLNASTFTARVVASTRSDAVSAVVGALGALKGPLHGGAPGPVLDMLDGVGQPENAVPWLEGELAAGRRIMGMGHRIYRVRDPRAAVLERATLALSEAGVTTDRLELAHATERAAREVLRARYPDRSLEANVEFFTAVLLDAVGLPREAFSLAFAASRVAGWLAHVGEERQRGKLIRPRSKYVGPAPAAL